MTPAEELESTQPVAWEEIASHEPVIGAQPAYSYTSSTESLERSQSVQSYRRTDGDTPSEDKVLVLDSAPESEDSDEESSEESDNTEGSNGDGEYIEDSNETASDTSSSTKNLQPSYGMYRSGSSSGRGRLGKLTKPSGATAPKRNMSSQPASTNDKRSRKRGRFVVEESKEDIDKEGEEEEENNNEVLSVPHHVDRSTKNSAPIQQLSSLTAVPPLSRYYEVWTHDQKETLCRLRSEGKDWEYIGERVLGRTATGARRHWERLRSEALKSVGKRNKARLRRQNDPLVLVTAKIPQKKNRWSNEEEELLISLRAQGMTLKYASKHLRGRGYSACKEHWRKIKDRYPFPIPASKLARMHGESVPSDSQDVHSPHTSQLEQEADDAGFDSRSATLEGDDLTSSTNGDSPITVGIDSLPTKRLYAQAVVIHERFVSADGSKRPKPKALPTDHQDQQAANLTTVGEAFTPGTKSSLHSIQPRMGSLNARRDLQTQHEPSFSKDSLLREPDILGNERGMREIGKHRRSKSWPY